MATPAYMSITGTKQGLITAGAFTEDSVGNTYQEGHEDQVMVHRATRSPASRPASACTSRWSSPRSSTRPRRCCWPP